VLALTVNSKWFSAKLDGTEEQAASIEIALANNRWGTFVRMDTGGHPVLS
jgi:hypothetical protein